MAECFEIVFILENTKVLELKQDVMEVFGLKLGDNKYIDKHPLTLFNNRRVVLELYDYEDADFIELNIALEGLCFDKSNFRNIIDGILEIVNCCFSKIRKVAFAVGIFEISSCYTGQAHNMSDFTNDLLSNFPLLFYKADENAQMSYDYTYGNTICIYNSHAQQLISND